MQKRTNRVLPALLVGVSAMWIALLVCPLLYSVVFPSPETRQLVRELEGYGTVPQQLDPLVQHAGLLRRAIPVKKYWHFSGDYTLKQAHTTVDTELSYIAWFQKLPKPMLLVITRTATGSDVRLGITVDSRNPFTMLWVYYVPLALLVSSVFWFWKSHTLTTKESSNVAAQEAAEPKGPGERRKTEVARP